jgi:16S rRNA (guanine527-N7)-methyltransferase
MPVPFEAIWENTVASSPFSVPAGLGAPLAVYRDELRRWNRKINLVSFKTDEELASRHFLDSLAALRFLPAGASVVDIGSGAGFPGCVIALARPDLNVVLIESILKKANFLRHLIRTLALGNLSVSHDRAENTAPGAFDIALGRAVAAPGEFVHLAKRLIKPGRGFVVVWLAEADRDQLAEFKQVTTEIYSLPGDDERRALALVTAPSPETVPSA